MNLPSAGNGKPGGQAAGVSGAQSIFRVLRILKYLGSTQARGVGVGDLARDLGLSQPTAHRMLAALTQEGFVSLHPTRKTYSLGREAYILGLAAQPRHGIHVIAEAALLRLAEQTGDTSFLSVRSGDEAVCLDRKTGHFPIKILTLDIGHRRPLGVGAGSMALLAFQPEEEIDRLLALYEGMRGIPGLVGARELRDDLDAIRSQGYALNPGRIIPDMLGMGVAVLDASRRPVAALSVAAIRSRLSGERRDEVAALLQREAQAVSLALNAAA